MRVTLAAAGREAKGDMGELEQIERYWELVRVAQALVIFPGTGVLIYRFVRPYVNRRRGAAAAGAAYTAAMIVLYFIPYEMTGISAYGAGNLAAFVLMYVLEPEKPRQKLFLGILMYLLDWIAHGISVWIRDFFFWAVLGNAGLAADPIRHLAVYAGVEVFCTAVRFLCAAALIWTVHRFYVCEKRDMDNRELALMLVTPLLVLAGYGTFAYTSEVYLADLGRYIWDGNPAFSWIKISYQLLSYLALLVQLAFYQRIKEGYQKEKETAVLEGQLADMKKYVEEVEGLYREIQGIRHDMGNHIMIMEQLMDRQPQEAVDYLKTWRQQLKQAAPEIKTGNPVTDVVLMEKLRRAGEQGVELVSEFLYPSGKSLNAFDISILLNNALDNAIEAAKECRAPRVHLRSWRRKNAYMLEVENPFLGEPKLDPKSGLPQSTRQGVGHGFGLANMQRVARRYQGDLAVSVEEGRFVLTVMLIL